MIPVMGLDWRQLAGLPSGELQSALLAELDTVMGGLSDRDEMNRQPESRWFDKPYVGLSNAGRLEELTVQHWTIADEEKLGDKLDAFLSKAVEVEARR